MDKEFLHVLPFVHHHPEQWVLDLPSLSCLKHRKPEKDFCSPWHFSQLQVIFGVKIHILCAFLL